MCPIVDEVVVPDVVGMLGSQAYACAIVEPQSFSFRLLGRNLHPFPPPQSLDPFVIDGPTGLSEKY